MGFLKKVTNSVKNVTKAAVTGNVKGVLKESVNAVKDGTKATAKFGKNLTMASVNAAINPGSASLKGLGRASFGLAGKVASQASQADALATPDVPAAPAAQLTGLARRRARQVAYKATSNSTSQVPPRPLNPDAQPGVRSRQQAQVQQRPVEQQQAKPMGGIKQPLVY